MANKKAHPDGRAFEVGVVTSYQYETSYPVIVSLG